MDVLTGTAAAAHGSVNRAAHIVDTHVLSVYDCVPDTNEKLIVRDIGIRMTLIFIRVVALLG